MLQLFNSHLQKHMAYVWTGYVHGCMDVWVHVHAHRCMCIGVDGIHSRLGQVDLPHTQGIQLSSP